MHLFFFFFNDTATPEIYPLSLHDALPISMGTAVTEVQQLLQVPKLRGTLGEVWLEELLRQILPGSPYQMQHVFRSGERGGAAPRGGDRLVPVDAQVPPAACQRVLGAARARG